MLGNWITIDRMKRKTEPLPCKIAMLSQSKLLKNSGMYTISFIPCVQSFFVLSPSSALFVISGEMQSSSNKKF